MYDHVYSRTIVSGYELLISDDRLSYQVVPIECKIVEAEVHTITDYFNAATGDKLRGRFYTSRADADQKGISVTGEAIAKIKSRLREVGAL